MKHNFSYLRRKRFEVCDSLKRSSIVFNLSIIKSTVKLIVNSLFILINISFGHEEKALLTTKIPCVVAVDPIPELQIHQRTKIHFQCDGKKTEFFLTLLDADIVLLLILLLLTISFLVWIYRFRKLGKQAPILNFHNLFLGFQTSSNKSG